MEQGHGIKPTVGADSQRKLREGHACSCGGEDALVERNGLLRGSLADLLGLGDGRDGRHICCFMCSWIFGWSCGSCVVVVAVGEEGE